MKLLSTGKHRESTASAPSTPFNTQGVFFDVAQAISRNIKTIKVGAIAVSSLLVVAMAGSTAPSFATNAQIISDTSSVSRSASRTDLTTETATVATVAGNEWALNSSSSNINVKYTMTTAQTNNRNTLVSVYEQAKDVYGSYSSASQSSLNALSSALNTAAKHLKDTTTSVSQYTADVNAISAAVSGVKESAAAAEAAASAATNTATTSNSHAESTASTSRRTASRSTTSSKTSSSTSSVRVSGSGSGASVASYGLSFAGKVPYVWGGNSTSGWDCSGFVKYVFAHFGVSLPRVSGAQATVGKPVASLAQAQPGDIIANGAHSGIYIGNGKVINALNPSSGTQVTPVSIAFYGSYSIRRVF